MYSCGELSGDLGHLYHHLNTAWNARDASEQQVQTCAAADFNRWGRFPRELLWSPQDDD